MMLSPATSRPPFARKTLAALALALAVACASKTFAGVIGFEEDFALAADRAATLAQLIPGTEDFYYYTMLNQQNSAQLDQADQTLKAWIKQLGHTPKAQEMQNRQALLKYTASPKESLDYLTRTLGLHFNHERETLARQAALPTQLDPAIISRERLAARALAENPQTLAGFENPALDWLAQTNLSDERLHDLLSRLTRPDLDNLVKLVAHDLSTRLGAGFGSLTVHREMLLNQLDDLLKLKPELLNDSNFVNIYLSKLRPPVGADLRHDPAQMTAYLDRIGGFASRLGPQHNSLKASILYQRLVFDRKQGVWDKDRFLAYLQLPRPIWYVSPLLNKPQEARDYPVDLNADFSAQAPILLPIRNDEPLVRSYLIHLLADAPDFDAFKPYVESTYLSEVFAEAKILAGIGDQDKWAAMLPAEKLQALKDRVEIDFAPANKDLYAPADKVQLTVAVKNVKTLIVKVYEVNAANFYKTYKREVNTDINLDGLVANEEQTIEYTDSPLRRIEHIFTFDSLKNRGVYVVEFIGNGKSSRALVRKGKLRYLQRQGAAGHIFTVLDEDNHPVNDARLWMAGHEYAADKDGEIQVPFSTSPGTESIVLESAGFASLEFFDHHAESYRLDAGLHVARESLLKYQSAKVVIRPALRVNDTPAPISLLEQPTLVITSVDLDGIAATTEVPDFPLHENTDSPYEFRIPDRLKSLTFTLKGKVQNVSQNKKDDLSFSRTVTLNEIDVSEKIQDLHVSKIEGNYVVDVLGKTGEQLPDQPIQISLKHRDFKQPVQVTLKTDAAGRIKLGALEDIEFFSLRDPEGLTRTFFPQKDRRIVQDSVHGAVGETLHIPYMGTAQKADPAVFSLLEVRDAGTFVADRLNTLTVKDGFLELKGLPEGDFNLLLKDSEQQFAIRIAPGAIQKDWVVSSTRFLQIKNRDPLQIVSVKADDASLTIQLANADKHTRVHVFATRFLPRFQPFHDLALQTASADHRPISQPDTVYESGRNIGDEYRYIIDRKYGPKFPGNMLARPGLLLNPWAIRSTDTAEQEAQKGQNYRGAETPDAAVRRSIDLQQQNRSALSKQSAPQTNSDDLDFLGEPAAVLLNLQPDDHGLITIPRKDLGSHQQFHVVAENLSNTVYREISVPQPAQPLRDLRMSIALDPAKHFTEQKQISILAKGETITINAAAGSRMESYDTLAKVYRLYSALKPDANLAEFSFILRWPSMKDAEKREKYSKYACHELNYFLFRKDPAFFQAVVKPSLAFKKDKTFMDHFLLGDDLAPYLNPWAFHRLNTVEQALLGQHIAAQQPTIARAIKERFDLLPPDIERDNFLFQTALGGNSLSKEGAASMSENMPAALFAHPGAPSSQAAASPSSGLAADAGKARIAEQKADRKTVAKSGDVSQKKTEEAFDQAASDDLGLEKDGKLRFDASARQLYRQQDRTMEYVENNYYHLPIEAQLAPLVNVNAFWKDFAQQKPGQPFLSKNLALPTSNFTEIMFALSALDLPFDEPAHTTQRDAGTFTLTAGGPLIAFHKEIKEAQPAAEKPPILVSQNYFRQNDRYAFVDNEQTDKYVAGEFLTHVVYGCQVVITNPTSSRQKLDAILQLPTGAIPVLNAQYSRGLHLDLQPYETKSIEYAFYFPSPGQFPHYPVQVAKNEKLVAFVPPDSLNVVATPSRTDTTSWDYISQDGTPDDVITYLNANNIQRINLEKIAWRMKDKDFFTKVIALLRDRHAYSDTLWSYSLRHDDPANINEYLQHQDAFVLQCGEYLDSPLLKIDPVARLTYQHMEYMPMVNARAHRLGQTRQILNDRFFQEYQRTLRVLRYHPALTDEDMLAAAYFLLLQDRIDEGLKMFQRVNPGKIVEKIQYDYLAAYAAFYGDNPAAARPIAEKYADYKVDRWRNLFTALLSQLDEIQGKVPAVVDQEDRNQKQNALAATEPSFEFKVDNKQIEITAKNLPQVQINYYPMDIELMFSQNPFLQEYAGQFSQFSLIKPNESAPAAIDPKLPATAIPLPEKFLTRNVMIEIVAAGQTRSQAYYANSLKVDLAENYGQLTVLSDKTAKPLPKAYVKVYAKMNDGKVRFYKDGYTDPRGKFDYTSLNTTDLDNVATFSLLILTDSDGAIIRTASPPKR